MAHAQICSIEGCGKKVRARGWCVNHYALWQRNGAPIIVKGSIKVCAVDGCGKPKKDNGWCAMHGWRYRKYGDPLKLSEPKPKPEVCNVSGCSSPPTGKRGMCNAHYLRWYRHGDAQVRLRAANGEPLEWVKRHVEHNGEDCLKWPYAVDAKGYAKCVGDGTAEACRIMCELAHGTAPSKVHQAAHACGKGHEGCINPQHLYWATPKENCADQIKHGTRSRGEKRVTAKLTEPQVREILAAKGSATQREIGFRYGVNPETIGNIHRRETWAWLE